MTTPALVEAHQRYLSDRAALAMAIKAGARSVDATIAGERLNLGHPLNCGGILLDYPDADGLIDPVSGPCRLRLDVPTNSKFLPRKGCGAPPYLPPSVVLDQSVYEDVTKPIIFAEGPYKALALCGAGYVGIGLGGVATGHDSAEWHDAKGRLQLHAYLLKRVKWQGRLVYVSFDAGRSDNPNVAYAEAMLAAALVKAGAIVRVTRLTRRPDGSDRGPDDFLADEGPDGLKKLIDEAIVADPLERASQVGKLTKGPERAEAVRRLLADLPFAAALYIGTEKLGDNGLLAAIGDVLKACEVTKADLKKIVEAFRHKLHEANKEDSEAESSAYTMSDGRTYVDGANGSRVVAHFTAHIVTEVVKDDGAERQRFFAIEGELPDGAKLPTAKVRAEEFASMDWVAREWGSKAVVEAGRAKDQTRAAIGIASKAKEEVLYTHTGWRVVNGEYVYLFNGGAVGADGVGVELEGTMANYRLPSATENLVEAVKASLKLLLVVPSKVAVPLLAAVYLAPLAFLLRPDFTIWLRALTGHFKSELAALVMAHFGSFSRKVLPASWSATETSLEGVLFRAKDAVVVIDDFKPPKDVRGHAELEKKAGNILQSIGNQSSKTRSRADLTIRPERPPRALVMSTGESIPETGSSTLARLVVVELDKQQVKLAELTEMQKAAARLPHAVRGYIEWLRPQLDALEKTLPNDREAARDYFAEHKDSQHQRQPENLAHLYVGFDLLVRFALDIKAIDTKEAERLRDLAYGALVALSEGQGADQREQDPGVQYLRVVRDVLEVGKVCLLDDGQPLDPEQRRGGPAGTREAIGWRVGADVMLLVGPSWRQVVQFERESGRHWQHRPGDVYAALEREGHIGRTAAGKFHRHRAEGRQHEVLRIEGKRLFGPEYVAIPPRPPEWDRKSATERQ